MAGLRRNYWQVSTGTGGRFIPESVAGLSRILHKLADKNFELLKQNPKHPSLHFKKIKQFWSVRVGMFYRALGIDVPEDNTVVWFWIGNHKEYDQLLS